MAKLLKVKALIAERGLFYRDVATAVHIKTEVFTNVLNGHQAPWPLLRARLADYFGMDESELFEDVRANAIEEDGASVG